MSDPEAESVSAPGDPLHAGPLNSIYARMFVPFAVALLLGSVTAWWLGTALLSRTLEDRVIEQLHHATSVVSQPGFPLAEPVLARLDRLLQASVFLLDPRGNVLLFSGEAPSVELQAALKQRYLDWQAMGIGRQEFHLESGGQDYLLVFGSVDSGKERGYHAVAAFSNLADVRAATRRGGLWLAALACCGITLLALIGHRVARSITVPVAELAMMSGTIAAGGREVRVDVIRQDEIGTLAQSLNSMAERLAHYEDQMLEQSRLATLGELSAKVAHEIRNPLTALKMQLQLLQDEVAQETLPRLAVIMDEVQRLELVVASTLQLSRPHELQLSPTDLNRIVGEVTRLVEPRFRHCDIDLQFDPGGNLPLCNLDENRVKQILLNVLNNAADELSGGGTIRVRTARTGGDYLAVEVSDSGPGIPRARRDQLFNNSVSYKSTGFGLGLKVTRELVELHGGRIEVGDSDLGGAIFRISFPLEISKIG